MIIVVFVDILKGLSIFLSSISSNILIPLLRVVKI